MKAPDKSHQESQVWWGGYSLWTMVPSLLLCVVLTGVITWWGWTFVERTHIRFAILGLSSLVWAVQTLRVGYRCFGDNYLLTTRRLVQEWGLFNKCFRTVTLDVVQAVAVERSNLEELLGVGRVVIQLANAEPPMILSGVRHCEEVAGRIRAIVAKTQIQTKNPSPDRTDLPKNENRHD